MESTTNGRVPAAEAGTQTRFTSPVDVSRGSAEPDDPTVESGPLSLIALPLEPDVEPERVEPDATEPDEPDCEMPPEAPEAVVSSSWPACTPPLCATLPLASE